MKTQSPRDTQEKTIKIEAEMKWYFYKLKDTKDSQKPLEARERGMEQTLWTLRGAGPCQHLQFELTASRTVREKHPYCFKPPSCGTLLQQP